LQVPISQFAPPSEERQDGLVQPAIAATGLVVRVRGSVIDVEFRNGALAALYEALVVEWDGAHPLLIETEGHLDPHTVRAVAIQNTAGLYRGCAVRKTGNPISVPVGEQVLGRLIDAVGEPIDGGVAFASDIPRWSIHRAAPPFKRQDPTREAFQTDIKVIDLLAPLANGGKAGMFGGAADRKPCLKPVTRNSRSRREYRRRRRDDFRFARDAPS
jgi:F-type H+-transporting ATPase subunit beta